MTRKIRTYNHRRRSQRFWSAAVAAGFFHEANQQSGQPTDVGQDVGDLLQVVGGQDPLFEAGILGLKFAYNCTESAGGQDCVHPGCVASRQGLPTPSRVGDPCEIGKG
jgi:hypothetical protein